MTYSAPHFQPWAFRGTFLVLSIPEDSNPQPVLPTSGLENSKPKATVPNLHFCFIFPTFKYSSNLWVYLGFFISIFYLLLLHGWSTEVTSKHELSICPRFLCLVATVQGKFCVYRCNGVSGSVFTTYNSISCLIFHEIVGEGSISEWLYRLSISFMSGSTKRDVGLQNQKSVVDLMTYH